MIHRLNKMFQIKRKGPSANELRTGLVGSVRIVASRPRIVSEPALIISKIRTATTLRRVVAWSRLLPPLLPVVTRRCRPLLATSNDSQTENREAGANEGLSFTVLLVTVVIIPVAGSGCRSKGTDGDGGGENQRNNVAHGNLHLLYAQCA